MPDIPESAGLAASEPEEKPTRRWPRVLGTIGIIAGVLMFVDKLDDLLMLPLLYSDDWWAGLMGRELAAQVVAWMPPSAWVVFASLVGMTLGALLFVGALRLRRGRRSGVTLCQAWSWLAIAWLVVEVVAALLWIGAHHQELRALAPGDWEGTAVLGTLLVVAVMAAFPVFLLIWFARPDIEYQVAAWPS